MKDVELKVLCELVRDGRRSDRDLAKAIGVSQPTVSSFRKKLEAEGIIQEYTVIPDFRKLGYEILAVTFIKLRGDLNPEEIEKARKIMSTSPEIILFQRGTGWITEAIVVSLHHSFSSYRSLIERMKNYPFVDLSETRNFMISLRDEMPYRPLTLKTLAQHVLAHQDGNRE